MVTKPNSKLLFKKSTDQKKIEKQIEQWNALGYVLTVNNKKIINQLKNAKTKTGKANRDDILRKCIQKQEKFNAKRKIIQAKLQEQLRIQKTLDIIDAIQLEYEKKSRDERNAKLSGLKLMKFQWAFYINYITRIANQKYYRKMKSSKAKQIAIEKNLKKLAAFGTLENLFRTRIFQEFVNKDLNSSKLSIFVAIESLYQLHEVLKFN